MKSLAFAVVGCVLLFLQPSHGFRGRLYQTPHDDEDDFGFRHYYGDHVPDVWEDREDATQRVNAAPCSPDMVNLAAMDVDTSKDRFYDALHRIQSTLQPPVFKQMHTPLCDIRVDEAWSYCLPIDGRKDEPYCNAPDRFDLLLPAHTPDSMCYASVLHLLLADVYDELQKANAKPALLYGTLLGAIRNGSIIPYTEDVDIGYQVADSDEETTRRMEDVQRRLWTKGYHMFHYDIWRVCVAPTHPLASHLYDPDTMVSDFQVPYVDLYAMEKITSGDWLGRSQWKIEYSSNDRLIPRSAFEPYSTATVNGVAFETVADPIDFVEREYGENYRMAQPRGSE